MNNVPITQTWYTTLMRSKLDEKNLAIHLRKQGLSYSEILRQVPVAKSSLGLWLKSVGLSKAQKQKLTQKKLESARRGGLAKKAQRIRLVEQIRNSTKGDITGISDRELWLMGIMLYWAEGSKSKEYSPSTGVIFSNSDPKMIKLFIKWCKNCLKIPDDEIRFDIYLHETKIAESENISKHWSEVTGFNLAKFDKIYIKRSTLTPKRKNIGSTYFGLLRVVLSHSTNVNRKIAAWTDEICRQCGVV